MSKMRSVNTHFWNDNYVIDCDPIEKLLFLYLITNANTNMLGIFEIHVRKIAFDTGIDKNMVLKIFDRFHKDGKASYIDGYVALHNFTKHQSYNDNMKKSAIASFHELPEHVRNQDVIISIAKGLEPLPKGSKPITEIEMEREKEYEREIETENERVDVVDSDEADYVSDKVYCDHQPEEKILHTTLHSVPIPDELDAPPFRRAYFDYWLYRKSKYTHFPDPVQVQMQYQELKDLADNGNDPVKVIRQTIAAGNKSFYPIQKFNSKPSNNGNYRKSKGDQHAERLERILS